MIPSDYKKYKKYEATLEAIRIFADMRRQFDDGMDKIARLAEGILRENGFLEDERENKGL